MGELSALNLHEDRVYVPDITASPMTPSNFPGEFWPKLETPESDGFVGDDDSALGEHAPRRPGHLKGGVGHRLDWV
jgi:hypothetical protein